MRNAAPKLVLPVCSFRLVPQHGAFGQMNQSSMDRLSSMRECLESIETNFVELRLFYGGTGRSAALFLGTGIELRLGFVLEAYLCHGGNKT